MSVSIFVSLFGAHIVYLQFSSIKFPLEIRSVDENLTYKSVFLTVIARDIPLCFHLDFISLQTVKFFQNVWWTTAHIGFEWVILDIFLDNGS